MELKTKLEILSGAAKYDASCASSGSSGGKSCVAPGRSFFRRGKHQALPEHSGVEGRINA